MSDNRKTSLAAFIFFGALIGAFVGWWRSDSNVWLVVSIVIGMAIGALAALMFSKSS